HPSVLDHVHPDDAITAKAALTDLLYGLVKGTSNIIRVPIRMVDSNGKSVHTLLAASVVQTSTGEADQLVVTVDNVDALVRQPPLDPAEPSAEDALASADTSFTPVQHE
ncbi:MAG TPA: DHH family phosphoesterase, partial [Kineosporiaceae bacterium]|nr:DHH family phosphoesterase [Kineosporiaceae bacterium]